VLQDHTERALWLGHFIHLKTETLPVCDEDDADLIRPAPIVETRPHFYDSIRKTIIVRETASPFD